MVIGAGMDALSFCVETVRLRVLFLGEKRIGSFG